MSDDRSPGDEIRLRVTGMTCAMCVQHVTRALERLDGVSKVEVTLSPPRAVVRYDPSRATPSAMVQAVRDAGYDAAV